MVVEPTRRECLSSVCKLELTSHKVVAYGTGDHLPEKVHVPFLAKKAVVGMTVEVLSERLQLKLANVEQLFDELYKEKLRVDSIVSGAADGGGGELERWPSSGSEGGGDGGQWQSGGGGQWHQGGGNWYSAGGAGTNMKSGWMNRAIALAIWIVNNDFDGALGDVVRICARYPKVYSEVWKSLGSINGLRGPLFGCGCKAVVARDLGSHERLVCCRAEVA